MCSKLSTSSPTQYRSPSSSILRSGTGLNFFTFFLKDQSLKSIPSTSFTWGEKAATTPFQHARSLSQTYLIGPNRRFTASCASIILLTYAAASSESSVPADPGRSSCDGLSLCLPSTRTLPNAARSVSVFSVAFIESSVSSSVDAIDEENIDSALVFARMFAGLPAGARRPCAIANLRASSFFFWSMRRRSSSFSLSRAARAAASNVKARRASPSGSWKDAAFDGRMR
mmetsp:Transcript_5572/g.16574  ORF Transcript_5572/g.16574 Transcript_5572/m.16574 type:complete len:228 (-) Transcript_5572:1521-2204(-)